MNEEIEDDDSVLVPRQIEVKMYLNDRGDVVISRLPEDWERQKFDLKDDDIFIVIPRLYVPNAIERLKTLLAEGG